MSKIFVISSVDSKGTISLLRVPESGDATGNLLQNKKIEYCLLYAAYTRRH